MKNKKTKEKLIEELRNLSEEEKTNFETLVLADLIYDGVLAKINFAQEDEVYEVFVKKMLKRQTRDKIIYTIWSNLSDEQAKHLRDFVNQMSIINPELEYDEVMLQFALMYPELIMKVHQSLDEFFKRFVENFNKLLPGK